MSQNLCPPGPSIGRLEGFLLATRRRDPLTFLMSVAREYGDIAHFQIGSRKVFLLNHPDFIKDALTHYYESFAKGPPRRRTRHFLGEGLLTSEGDSHRRQQLLIQPAFHRQQINSHEAIIMEHGVRAREQWQPGQQISIMPEMKRLALGIISKIIFDAKTEEEADEIYEAVRLVVSQFSPFGSPLGNLLAKLPMSPARRIRKAQAKLDALVSRLIYERRQSGADRGDLLSMLISTLDETGADDRINDLRIRDQALTFFLAGHETVGTALAWTWYLLAHNPAAQAKLNSEIDAVVGSRIPTLDDVAQLHYTKMVFAEAMRMYPPVWVLGRYLIKDFTTGGYLMPAGSVVIISQYVTHHDSRYFPHPTRFDPERWTPERKASRPQYSYFPFGGGPRRCMGEGLAWIQGVLLIATIAQRWRMQLVSSRPVELRPLLTLQSKREIKLKLELREQRTHNSLGGTDHCAHARNQADQLCERYV